MLNFCRRTLFFLLILFTPFALAGAACPSATELPAPEALREMARQAPDRGFLWRIGKDGRTSYLYGTMHVAKPEWMFPGPAVREALRAADIVALELDVSDPDIQQRIAQGMAAQRAAALPDALVQRMQRRAKALCLPYEAIARMTPEFQVVTLSVLEARWEGLDPAFAIDSMLGGAGRAAGKAVVSLETPELQLQTLQMDSHEETILFVKEGLADLESGRARTQLRRTAQVWSEGDHADMARFEQWCDCLDTATDRKMMQRLLDGRNPALADSIDALHAGGKQVFAAVGSLHLFGAAGLPQLMEQRGYRVQRVDFARTAAGKQPVGK